MVEIHNLQRQVLHDEASVGVAKTTSASARLTGIDSGVRVVEHLVRLDAENAPGIFADYDVVLDCTDNFAARYVINDACVALGLPEVWAAVFRTSAQVSVFWSAVGGPQPVSYTHLDVYKRQDLALPLRPVRLDVTFVPACLLYTSRCV